LAISGGFVLAGVTVDIAPLPAAGNTGDCTVGLDSPQLAHNTQ
jgi:hypothetical protein